MKDQLLTKIRTAARRSASSASATSACRWRWSSRRRASRSSATTSASGSCDAADARRIAHPGRAGDEVARAGRSRALRGDDGRDRACARCDAISIAVPTPLAKTRDPDMSYVIAATEAIARNAIPGMLVVLESTTYPGHDARSDAAAARGARAHGRRRTSSSRSAPSASIRAIRRGTRRTRRKSSAASRRPAPRSRPRSTRRASTRWFRCRRTEAAELVKLLENTFRVGEHRPRERDGDRLRQARRRTCGK